MMILFFSNTNNKVVDGQDLCGISPCSALKSAKEYADESMVKMIKMINPDALEKVFSNMDQMEDLIRMIQDLNRDVRSLFQPGK